MPPVAQFISVLVPLALVLPLLVAVLLAIFGSRLPRLVIDLAATATAFIVTGFCVLFLIQAAPGRIVYAFGGWAPRGGVVLGILFVIDPLGAGLATLVAALTTAVLLFSWRYFKEVKAFYHVLVLVFLAAMVGFCLTGDIFNLFVLFELMGVAAFALTAYQTEASGPLEGALNFAITNSVGALLILIGIGLLYGRTGALNMAQIGHTLATQPSDNLIVVAFVVITAGFFVKAAVVPFHFWQADAHASAPTPICVLFACVMDELGLYAIFRLYWVVFSGPLGPHFQAVRAILVAFGVLTALLGAVMCPLQHQLKRLLAFSTLSHLGMFLIGAALLTPLGMAGTTIYLLSHAMVKGALYFCTGILAHRFKTVSLARLHGRGRALPWTGLLFLLGGLGLASLPPFGTYLGKGLMEDASRAAGYSWLLVVLVVASIGTGGAVLRAAGGVFLGLGQPGEDPSPASGDEEKDAESEPSRGRTPVVMFLPALVLILAGIAIGLLPRLGPAAEMLTARFENRTAYTASVLGPGLVSPQPSPPLAPADPNLSMVASGLIATALAILCAALAILWPRLPKVPREVVARPFRVPLGWLRALQSGHPGDYVFWLTLGALVLGIACALTLR